MSRSAAVQRDPAFQRLKSAVLRATGLAYYTDKDSTFAERVGRRLAARSIPTLTEYLMLLETEGPGGPEYQALINELAVGETFFFRYIEQFEALRAVAIPECLRRNQTSRSLRIWSAGCSTGPEVYTLEILLKRYFATDLRGWQVSIAGTDINGSFLDQARRGAYGGWALRGLPQEVIDDCFDRCGDRWMVKPQFREWSSFSLFNLVEDPLPNYPRGLSGLDIVLCRNVMIYFDEATRTRLLSGLHATLSPNGWLVVGHAETGPHMNGLFTPVSVPGATLYRKSMPGLELLLPAPPPRPLLPEPPPKPRLPPPAARTDPAPPPAPLPAPAAPPPADASGGSDRAAALEACLALAERNRLDPIVHFRLGLLEEELGVGDPVAAFKRALYLDSGFALADYHLALAYWRRGKLAAAQRHFRNARAAVAGRDGDEAVAEGGGLTVSELRSMIELWFSGEEG